MSNSAIDIPIRSSYNSRMRHFLSTLVIFLCLMPDYSFAVNPLDTLIIRHDHQLHFLVSYVAADIMQQQWRWDTHGSYTALEAAGVVKELLDNSTGGQWDRSDQTANRLGWLAYNIVHPEHGLLTEKGDSNVQFIVATSLTDFLQNEWQWESWQSLLALEVLGIVKEAADGRWDNTDRDGLRSAWLVQNAISIRW